VTTNEQRSSWRNENCKDLFNESELRGFKGAKVQEVRARGKQEINLHHAVTSKESQRRRRIINLIDSSSKTSWMQELTAGVQQTVQLVARMIEKVLSMNPPWRSQIT